MSDSTKIMLIVQLIFLCGYFFGWIYVKKNQVAKLKKMNKELRKVEIREIIAQNGSYEARMTEWPLNAEEYLNHYSLERDGGPIEITFEGLESHMNGYARHLLTKQKNDFMKMCKEIKNGEEISKKLNS